LHVILPQPAPHPASCLPTPTPLSPPSSQVNHRDEWLSCLRATFEDLDKDRDGKIGADDIIRVRRGEGRGGEGRLSEDG
jgi:hypothetical protein